MNGKRLWRKLFHDLPSRGTANTPRDTGIEPADKGKNTQVAEGITEEQPQFFDVQKAQFRKMGETISGIDVQHGTVIEEALRYTFTKAALFESFAEAGLEEAKQNLAEAAPFLTEDGELKPGVRLLLVDVTVQNVRAESLRNITELNTQHLGGWGRRITSSKPA